LWLKEKQNKISRGFFELVAHKKKFLRQGLMENYLALAVFDAAGWLDGILSRRPTPINAHATCQLF
jgi:hypothetical protein